MGIRRGRPFTGYNRTYQDHTANDTLLAADSKKRQSNKGASGTITLILPDADGTAYTMDFHVLADTKALRIDPNTTQQIHVNGALQAAGKYISASVLGSSIRLYTNASGIWRTRFKRDAWSVEA